MIKFKDAETPARVFSDLLTFYAEHTNQTQDDKNNNQNNSSAGSPVSKRTT